MTETFPPIFVVGAPRSGTTLLAAMIGAHSAYAIGPETQFFSKLAPLELDFAVADPAWPLRAVDALASLTLAGQEVLSLFGSGREEAARFLAQRSPSPRAMLEALTVPFARRRGKPAWAEKTPNHLLNLDTIRALWPDAWIVRIMRDPRDSALSTCRLPTFSDAFAANLYLWRSWQDAAEPFLARDARSMTLRYETLVQSPESELARMCAAMGIIYEPTMLDFARSAADVGTSAETWKRPVSGGLNADRMFAWKNALDPHLRALADQVTHEYLERFDYDRQERMARTRYAYRLSPAWAEHNEGFLTSQLDRGIRWLPTDDPERADRVVEQPAHTRFRDPRLIARLALDRCRTGLLEGLAPR